MNFFIFGVVFHIVFSVVLGLYGPNIVWTKALLAGIANTFRYLSEVYSASILVFLLSLIYLFRSLKYLFVSLILALIGTMNIKYLGPQAHFNYGKSCVGNH